MLTLFKKYFGQDKILEEIAANSGQNIIFERVTGYTSKPSVVKTFQDYGLVIMSTHGFRYGYVVGALKIPDIFKSVLSPKGVYKLQRARSHLRPG